MTVSLKIASFPLLLTMALASSSVLADGLIHNLIRDRNVYGTPSGIGQQFNNFEHADQLRHRVNPLYSHDRQEKYQHRYQYREQSGGPHRHQSGSMGRGSSGSRSSGGSRGSGGGRGR